MNNDKYLDEIRQELEKNSKGHIWRKDRYDDIDIFAFEDNGGFCNGPVCEVCGYGFCRHCNNNIPAVECKGANN